MCRCLSCMKEFNNKSAMKGREICPFCGAYIDFSPRELYHLKPGTLLKDRYILGLAIGFGGFGIIYKAWDKTLDTVVAIKEYYPTGLVQRAAGESQVHVFEKSRKKDFYAGLTRFMSEAKNMSRFMELPNIVHIENYFEENNTAYIVMEYLDGRTLKAYLEEKGKLSKEETLKLIYPIMDALSVLHKEDILHRDVSPDNIFLCNDGQVKLIDFGATRFSDVDNEVTRSIVLKPGYAPAEQYRAKSKQGPYTDIYAVGATMYKCLTGVDPEEAISRNSEDNLVSPENIDDSIPRYLSEAIMKAMAVEGELRFKNMHQFKRSLEKQRLVKSEKQEIKYRKLRRAFVVALAIIIIVAGGFGAYRYYQYKTKKIVLDKATISIWIPARVGEETIKQDLEASKQQFQSMVDVYLREQSNVTVEITPIPDYEYEEKLIEAAREKNLPTIFISDNVSGEVLNSTVPWTDVYDYLDVSNCYFLSEYRQELEVSKQFPTAFNVPVIYVRRTNGIDFETAQISEFEQLSEAGSKGYYIDSDSYYMFFKSMGGDFDPEDETVIDEATIFMLQSMKEELASKEYKVEDNTVEQDMAFELFQDGEITYYLSSVSDYQTIRDTMPGLYSFRPMFTENVYGEFCGMWSIGVGASEEEILAAKVLINYLLAERPQKALFLQGDMLPLNKTTFSTLSDIDGNYSVVGEYVDRLTFDSNKSTLVDDMEKSLYQDIIIDGDSPENWRGLE